MIVQMSTDAAAKGQVIDAYTSWEWSTLCDEISKLNLHRAKLIILPVAKGDTPETTPVSEQVFTSDSATVQRTRGKRVSGHSHDNVTNTFA
jgi:hypothetical protein